MKIYCRECGVNYIDFASEPAIHEILAFGFFVWCRDINGELYCTCENCTDKVEYDAGMRNTVKTRETISNSVPFNNNYTPKEPEHPNDIYFQLC